MKTMFVIWMVTNSVWSRTDQVFDDYRSCKGSAVIETFLSGYNISTNPLSLTPKKMYICEPIDWIPEQEDKI
jgi:hypothetical protein